MTDNKFSLADIGNIGRQISELVLSVARLPLELKRINAAKSSERLDQKIVLLCRRLNEVHYQRGTLINRRFGYPGTWAGSNERDFVETTNRHIQDIEEVSRLLDRASELGAVSASRVRVLNDHLIALYNYMVENRKTINGEHWDECTDVMRDANMLYMQLAFELREQSSGQAKN